MSRKKVKYAMSVVGLLLMALAISSSLRLSTIAASNKPMDFEAYPDLRLVTFGILDDTDRVIDATSLVRVIRFRILLMIGTGIVMVLIGFWPMRPRLANESAVSSAGGLAAK